MSNPWQQIQETMNHADTIERLIRLRKESGCSWEEAFDWAVAKVNEHLAAKVKPPTTTGE